MQLYDLSVQDDEDMTLRLNVFRPEKEMPAAGCGDVIVLFSVKVRKSHITLK